jgi:uncharacterized membrane protein
MEDFKYKEWHDDENNWKMGIFYFNPADQRIFPPKRIKQLGWTLNFARWQAWLVLLLIMLLIAFLGKLS